MWQSTTLKRYLRKWKNYRFTRSVMQQSLDSADVHVILRGASKRLSEKNRASFSLRMAFCYWVVSARWKRRTAKHIFRIWRMRTGLSIVQATQDKKVMRSALSIWKRHSSWPKAMALNDLSLWRRGWMQWLLFHQRRQVEVGADITGHLHADGVIYRWGFRVLYQHLKQRSCCRKAGKDFSQHERRLRKQHFRKWHQKWSQCCMYRSFYYQSICYATARNCQRMLRQWCSMKVSGLYLRRSFVQELRKRAERHICSRYLRVMLGWVGAAYRQAVDLRRAQWWYHRSCLLRWQRVVTTRVRNWRCEQGAIRLYRATLMHRYFYGVWLRRQSYRVSSDLRGDAAAAVVGGRRIRWALRYWTRWSRKRVELRHVVLYVRKRLLFRRWRKHTKSAVWSCGIAVQRGEMRYTVRAASLGLERWRHFILKEKVLSVCLGTFRRLQAWRATQRVFHAWRRNFTPYMKRLHMADSFVHCRTEARLLYHCLIRQWRQAWDVRRSKRHFQTLIVRRWHRRYLELKQWWRGQQQRVLEVVGRVQSATDSTRSPGNAYVGVKLSTIVLRSSNYRAFLSMSAKRRFWGLWRAFLRSAVQSKLMAERIRRDQVELIGRYAVCSAQVQERTEHRAMARALAAMTSTCGVKREAMRRILMQHSGRRWFAAWRLARKQHYVYRLLPRYPDVDCASDRGLKDPVSTHRGGAFRSNPVMTTLQKSIDASRLSSQSSSSSTQSSPAVNENSTRGSSQVLTGYKHPVVFHTPLRKTLRGGAVRGLGPGTASRPDPLGDISNIRHRNDESSSVLMSPHQVDISLGAVMHPQGHTPVREGTAHILQTGPAVASEPGRATHKKRYGSVMVDPTAVGGYSSSFRTRAKCVLPGPAIRSTTPTHQRPAAPTTTTQGSVGTARAQEWDRAHAHDHAVHMQRLKNLYARCQTR